MGKRQIVLALVGARSNCSPRRAHPAATASVDQIVDDAECEPEFRGSRTIGACKVALAACAPCSRGEADSQIENADRRGAALDTRSCASRRRFPTSRAKSWASCAPNAATSRCGRGTGSTTSQIRSAPASRRITEPFSPERPRMAAFDRFTSRWYARMPRSREATVMVSRSKVPRRFRWKASTPSAFLSSDLMFLSLSSSPQRLPQELCSEVGGRNRSSEIKSPGGTSLAAVRAGGGGVGGSEQRGGRGEVE